MYTDDSQPDPRESKFHGILDVLKKELSNENRQLPEGFPSLDDHESWNTLPYGVPGKCRRALMVDLYDPETIQTLLWQTLIHVSKSQCAGITSSVVFVVGVDLTLWNAHWDLFDPEFLKVGIRVHIEHLYVPHRISFVSHQLCRTTEFNNFCTWSEHVNRWNAETRRNFGLALFTLRNDPQLLDRYPKIIGSYSEGPFAGSPILVFGELPMGFDCTKPFLKHTNQLRFRLDGKKYAIALHGINNWTYVNL
jgi:hypothetical protein